MDLIKLKEILNEIVNAEGTWQEKKALIEEAFEGNADLEEFLAWFEEDPSEE
jgi:hypothetical protein